MDLLRASLSRGRAARGAASRPTLGTLPGLVADLYGARTALEAPDGQRPFGHSSLTYRELDSLVRGVAAGLGRDLCGERVIVRTSNGIPTLVAMLALSAVGAVPIPVNPELSESELEHVVSDSGARFGIADFVGEVLPGTDIDWLPLERRVDSNEAPALDASEAAPDDAAAIFYTSGTTGRPKGAVLTHSGLLSDLRPAMFYPARLRRDLMVEALPVAHIMGFAVLCGALLAGVRTLVFERFHPVEILDAIESRRATLFVGVPAMYRMMLDAGAEDRDLKSVRAWMSAADVMPKELARRFQKMGALFSVGGRDFGEALFLEGYGMVELSGAVSVKVALPHLDLFSNSVGIPLPGNRIKVVDENGEEVAIGEVGEIAVKGPGVLRGYHNNPRATGEVLSDGWLRTGDLARRGRFLAHFEGRAKDVIMSGGYSVFSVEVEEELRRCPGVRDVAVVGIEDPTLGEKVAAVVEPVEPGSIGVGELEQWAEREIAGYKRPAIYLIVDQLPRGATRKVQKEAAKKLLIDR